ncbi:WXG100 family type VII secretion target [Mycobacterium ahvazicum]|uniref:WXG100 family type VII secretion target n=1 Tax=Mycobacterium ahvazicum TaxID=1964395 RepID=UPI0013FDCCC9|nr:WXG100 family type VII secretion target [Mycobacterium ahvazicum]
MARRTVNEAELVDAADALRQFCQTMKDRLNEVATDLKGLQQTWDGVGFDAFLERLQHWQRWADEMSEVVFDMHLNAHIAHRNYVHNAEVNTAMWGG